LDRAGFLQGPSKSFGVCLTRYRFVAPVMIDVYAEGPIDQEEMAWFLSQKCFVSMDGLDTGVGPGDSVVLPVVDWEALRMMKGGSGRKPI
jgi:hypothetical protein